MPDICPCVWASEEEWENTFALFRYRWRHGVGARNSRRGRRNIDEVRVPARIRFSSAPQQGRKNSLSPFRSKKDRLQMSTERCTFVLVAGLSRLQIHTCRHDAVPSRALASGRSRTALFRLLPSSPAMPDRLSGRAIGLLLATDDLIVKTACTIIEGPKCPFMEDGIYATTVTQIAGERRGDN